MTLTRIWHQSFGQVDAETRSSVRAALTDAGLETVAYDADGAGNLGIILFEKADGTLLEFLRETSRRKLCCAIAIATSPEILPSEEIWRLLEAGAFDVFSCNQPEKTGPQIAARFRRWQAVGDLVSSPVVRNNLIGQSPVWMKLLRQIVEIARFTDGSVLITGESGTGKELAARLIHTLDQRRNKSKLVVVDCTTIVPELSGSEFFGHERGAFTGAVAQREGAFALADGGTLFLDEVGELPLTLQAELLRVVQEHTYKRVGSNSWRQTDFRLICATNRNLLEQERRGEFRRDFYHRIATWTCHLAPLRERLEDILPLARHFFNELSSGKEPLEIDSAVREYLIQRSYPGNVRELYQLVTRISCRHDGSGPITAGNIPESERPASGAEQKDWRGESFERSIRRALLLGVNLKTITDAAIETAERLAFEESNDNNARAAEKLGINERTLQLHRAARRQRLE